MPLINFHAARVRDPEDFLRDSKYWATIILKGVEGIELVTGKLKKDGPGGPMVAQAYHFDKEKWTEKKAKKWMKRHKVKPILFEPAKEEIKEGIMGTTSMAANVGPPSFENVWERVMKKKKKEKPKEMNEQKVVATTDGDSDYGYTFKGSFEETTQKVRAALKETKKYGDWQNILATFEDKAYFSVYDSMTQKTRYFEIEYEIEDGEVTLGDPTEVVKKTEWIIKEQAEAIAAGLFPITEDEELLMEAKWSTKFINDLPDSSFAFIKKGGEKDEEGKTKPRSLRYLPYKDADGEIDLPHLRNALARLPQTDLSDDEKKKALKVLEKAAKEAGVGQKNKK